MVKSTSFSSDESLGCIIQGVSGNYVDQKSVDSKHREHHFDIGHLVSETSPKGAMALSSWRPKVGRPCATLAGKAMRLCHFSGLWLPTWVLAPRHGNEDLTWQRGPNRAMWAQHGGVDQTWQPVPNNMTTLAQHGNVDSKR